MKRAARGGRLHRLRAGLATLALLGCGDGREVNLGSVRSATPSDGGPPPNPAAACADHRGSTSFVEPSAAGAALDAFARAEEVAPGAEPSAEPALLYPSNETLLPVNLSRVRFAWSAGEGTLFALDFSGPNTQVRVVTADTSFSAADTEWEWIAESNRGQRVDVVVRALSAEQDRVWRSPSVALYFDESGLDGTVYYWSTGSRGLMEARPNGARARRVFSDPFGADAQTCTGCHTVSRDGKRLAVGYDKNQLAEIALADRSAIVPLGSVGIDPSTPPPDAMMMDGGAPPPKDEKPPPLVWSTFSPDGSLLLVAGGGKLRLIDADTGAPVGPDQGTVALPSGVTATHPDWSPLGDRVAITLSTKGGDKQTEGGSIALLPYTNGAFGDPTVVVANTGDKDNDFFPSFSPDGRYLAFVNAQGGSQEATSAHIRLLEVETGEVRELERLNQRVAAEDLTTDLGNTMPTWGPLSAAGTYWLAFSSLRPYADLRPLDPKQDQLFIAGIDPTLDDPSYAAFWAPFQSLGQGNHRAFFVGASAPGAAACADAGDPREDDCAPAPDAQGRTPACSDREVCDNGTDDDCDCVIDDCSVEICDDGVDNDGDGKTDKMDLSCAGR